MATYLAGITDYIPQIQPFQPDYNFLSNVLQTKQSRYDAAHKQISTLYGSLLNAPLSRDENIEKRNQLFKTIEQDIKRLSGLDLSLPQNVDAAKQVFKGISEDQDIAKDMVWTKQWMHELKKADNLKNCIDPDKCGGSWWEGGIQLLNYQREDFRKATKEQALGFSSPEFVPHIDVTGKAMKLAKDMGFTVKFDTISNGYIVTDKNGAKMAEPLSKFFISQFGSDPKVMQYFNAQGSLYRRNWIAAKTQELGNEELATQAFVKDVYSNTSNLEKERAKAEAEASDANNAAEAAQKAVAENGVLPGDKSIASDFFSILQSKEISDKNKAVHDEAYNIYKNTDINASNLSRVLSNMDRLIGFNMLKKEMNHAATAYSSLTAERNLQADPYSLAKYNASLDIMKHKANKATDFEYWKKEKEIEFELKKQQDERVKAIKEKVLKTAGSGLQTYNDQPGTGTPNLDPNYTYKNNLQQKTIKLQEVAANKSAFVNALVGTMRNALRQGNDKDYLVRDAMRKMFDKTGVNYDPNTLQIKDADKLALNPNIDKIYQAALSISDPNSLQGIMRKSWSSQFWNQTADLRASSDRAEQYYQAYDNFFKKQAEAATKNAESVLRLTEENPDNELITLTKLLGEQAQSTGFITTKDKTAIVDKYLREKGEYVTPEKVEETFKKLEKANDIWLASYSQNAASWDSHPGKPKVTGRMAGILGGRADAADQNSTDTDVVAQNEHLRSLLNKYSTISTSSVVQFGDLSNMVSEGHDAKAAQVLQQFIMDFNNPEKTTNEDRAMAEWRFSTIAGYNKDTVGVVVKPSESWAKKYVGSKERPGITYDNLYQNGIVVFMPKSQVSDLPIVKANQITDTEFVLNTQGYLDINSFPSGGNARIDKVGNQYQISLNAKVANPNAKSSSELYTERSMTWSVPIGSSDALVDDLTDKLAKLAAYNEQSKTKASSVNGIKDIAQILQLNQ